MEFNKMKIHMILSIPKQYRILWSTSSTSGQLFRYGVIGMFNNFAGYLLYLFVTYFGATPKLTMSILYIMGAMAGFLGNRQFTFAHTGNILMSGMKYAATHLLGYSMNFIILYLFVDIYGYPHQFIQAVAIIIVAGFLFISFKLYVFRRKDIIIT